MVQKEAKRRGRPPAYDPQVALAAAVKAFWKAGYAATSLDDLSAATGMNRPSLYGAFGDKREIYLKALAHYWGAGQVSMSEALAGDRPLREALAGLYAKALDLYFSGKGGARGCFLIGTALTESVGDAEVRGYMAEVLRQIDEAFEARIRAAQASGELPGGADPVALARLASATLHTLAIRSRAGASRAELDKLAAGAVNVICGASTGSAA
jgi:TetR/AcrR family transcriptional regulator, copper-responsive repressor